MNVAASASAHFGAFTCPVAGNCPTVAIVDHGREGEALGGAYGMPDVFLTICERIDED